MALGSMIRKRRLELNLTLLDVAKKVNVSEATVQRWESGNIKNLRHERIALLAEALECSPAYLMGWEDKEQNKKAPPSEEGDALKSSLDNIYDNMNEKGRRALVSHGELLMKDTANTEKTKGNVVINFAARGEKIDPIVLTPERAREASQILAEILKDHKNPDF